MLQEYFTEITDPRQQVKVKHNLLEIVVMTICAVIAGCEALGMKLTHGIPFIS